MLALASKKLLVVGLGKSGLSVVNKANELGAEVWGYDEKSELRVPNFELRDLKDFDLVVTSPGIPFDHEILRLAAKEGWPVISEVEFAYQLLEPEFIIGVTGTNGKTTVVEILSHIFKLSGKPFTVAGNIGTPLSSLDKIEGSLILELSSFQLHFIDKFRANVGVILNVTEDHLDWHCCFGQYLEDKLRLFSNQKEGDIALLNVDDSVLKNEKLQSKTKNGKILTFGIENSEVDYYLKDGYLMAGDEKIIAAKDLKLIGNHNLANVLAAVACARGAGLNWQPIRDGLATFEGLKHRLQFVSEKQGVAFYNDSKSTNPDSTYKAVEAFKVPIILIMGGRNKGNNFSSLNKYLGNQVKNLVLYGEAATEIKGQVGAGHISKTVEEALQKAISLASGEEVVLFSPGCASFDLFSSYAERGNAFIKAVKEL